MTIGEERDHFGYDPITDTYREQDDYFVGKGISTMFVSYVIALVIVYFINGRELTMNTAMSAAVGTVIGHLLCVAFDKIRERRKEKRRRMA